MPSHQNRPAPPADIIHVFAPFFGSSLETTFSSSSKKRSFFQGFKDSWPAWYIGAFIALAVGAAVAYFSFRKRLTSIANSASVIREDVALIRKKTVPSEPREIVVPSPAPVPIPSVPAVPVTSPSIGRPATGFFPLIDCEKFNKQLSEAYKNASKMAFPVIPAPAAPK